MVLFLILGMIALPFILWFAGLTKLAGFVGLYVIFSIPSFIAVVRMRVKDGQWPKIAEGPGIPLGGKRYGLW
ncbi:MAG: hypothetical protein NTZ13_02365 [Candidatus Parcubacteria bacterium]|nr:hypothetical protein [Candidatus Parcubacteria bacterium]